MEKPEEEFPNLGIFFFYSFKKSKWSHICQTLDMDLGQARPPSSANLNIKLSEPQHVKDQSNQVLLTVTL